MNIIKCVAWKACDPLYEQWNTIKPDLSTGRPQKVDTLVYVDLECIRGKTAKRTFGYIKMTPGDETTADNIIGCAVVREKTVNNMKVAYIEKFGINPDFYHLNTGEQLLDVCMSYMFQAQFDISVAFPLDLDIFQKFGYLSLPKDNEKNIMMFRPIKGMPINCSVEDITKLKV